MPRDCLIYFKLVNFEKNSKSEFITQSGRVFYLKPFICSFFKLKSAIFLFNQETTRNYNPWRFFGDLREILKLLKKIVIYEINLKRKRPEPYTFKRQERKRVKGVR